MKIKHIPLLTLLSLLFACGGDNSGSSGTIINDARFGEYISGYTSGTISQKDNINVQFTNLVPIPDDPQLNTLFSISPSIKGTLVKTGPHAITISPETPLKSGQKFIFTLNLQSLIEVPKELGQFKFEISIIEQNFEVILGEMLAPDPSTPDQLQFEGTVNTADFAENEAVEKMIQMEGSLPIAWQHRSGTSHRFAVTGITRTKDPKTIQIKASGAPIGVKRSEDLRIEVPSQAVFSMISTKVDNSGDPFVAIYFSDPLDPAQNLAGLINLEGVRNPGMVIEGNQVKVYVPQNMTGSKKLEIFEGIKNSKGQALGKTTTSYIPFEPEKPQLRLVGNGTILPSTSGLVLPFESVNLKAVQVEVVKIFEANMPAFFQVNNLSGEDQINRVGRKIMRRKIDLSAKAEDLSSWNRFTLDLSTLFEAERGALYQVRIGFLPEYTNYPCDQVFEVQDNPSDKESWSIHQDDNFYEWGNLWDYRYPDGYTWKERDNPCHVSYYNSNRFVSTSLLATDIGLIAKIGGDNTMKVIATNMTNAQPIQATIKVLDYQLQEMSSSMTDAQGFATIKPERRPFLIIAEAQGQKSYLRLEDNESLSLSNFDVSGTRVIGNIKGMVYGERGVWRPGDDIFLSFMLEDPEKQIPDNHPVVMELRDPRGNIKDKQVVTQGVKGLYTFQTKTSPDDVTGNWWTTVSVGNNSFAKTVKVETVKPNRLKINLDLGGDQITYENRAVKGKLNVKWLTGLTGSNLKAETELRLVETNTTFNGYAQYEFDDAGKSFYDDPKQIFSGEVDQNGDATVNLQLPSKPNSPGALKAIFNTKVFEPGAGFSVNSKAVTYLPYSSFVGVNLSSADQGSRIERDKPQQVDLITLGANGQPVDRTGVEVKIYKLNWRWWWDQSDDYSTNYVSSSYAELIESKKINTTAGKGKINFTIKSPNWGRFIVVARDPVSGHSSSQVFYTSWYGSSGGNAIGATSLEVSTDKAEYAVGEKINVTMRGSYEGQALISIENGSSVVQNFWIKTEKEWTSFTVYVTPEMAPNVYLHASLLQPHGQTSNDLPVRLYGIASIQVYDKETRLEPTIRMANELAPNEPVEITVTEKNGKPMAYTLAVVDDGLLDLTNFKTPAPWDHFYSKEAIGVKTWDLYNDVIGAYGGRLERLLAIGGGEGGLDDSKKKEENRFKPVVQFMGPFYLEGGQSKKHTFTMPQYIGSVRTMVVAGLGGAYGSAEKSTPVIKPLMVLGTLPRVVGPGELVSLPVNVFKYKENIKNATITVETSGVLSLKGSTKQTIELRESNGTLYFDLAVAEKLGPGKVTITASSGSESARHDINIESRSPNSAQTIVKVLPVEAGQAVTPGGKLFGMEGTNKVTLEVASIPPINLEHRLSYLIRYPHGCIEQTVSSVFPQLFLKNITELTVEEQVKIENNIKTAIKRLSKFQVPTGGLGYWPGYDNANSWGTSYAYHFLIEAQKQGYSVPGELIEKVLSYQRNKARNWSKSVDHRDSDLIQAYRLFTLALAGYPEIGAMNRLRNTSDKSVQSVHKLAAAYAIIGQKEAAQTLMKDYGRSKVKDYGYSYYYYSYGSFERDLALLLETYVYMDSKAEAYKILQEISERLSADGWMSTQTTAYSLLAISKYITANQTEKGMKAGISNGGKNTTWSSDKAIYKSELPIDAIQSLKIDNKGESNFFVTLSITGTPKPGDEPVAQSDLAVSVRYLDPSGRSLSPDSLKLGQSFDVLITVKNEYAAGSVKDIALTHILPSGWEIQNDRLTDQETSEYSAFDYQDIRDDRVYTYFDLSRDSQKVFKVSVTAAYPGKYYMPGIQAEAMYKASISAKTAGKWVYITK